MNADGTLRIKGASFFMPGAPIAGEDGVAPTTVVVDHQGDLPVVDTDVVLPPMGGANVWVRIPEGCVVVGGDDAPPEDADVLKLSLGVAKHRLTAGGLNTDRVPVLQTIRSVSSHRLQADSTTKTVTTGEARDLSFVVGTVTSVRGVCVCRPKTRMKLSYPGRVDGRVDKSSYVCATVPVGCGLQVWCVDKDGQSKDVDILPVPFFVHPATPLRPCERREGVEYLGAPSDLDPAGCLDFAALLGAHPLMLTDVHASGAAVAVPPVRGVGPVDGTLDVEKLDECVTNMREQARSWLTGEASTSKKIAKSVGVGTGVGALDHSLLVLDYIPDLPAVAARMFGDRVDASLPSIVSTYSVISSVAGRMARACLVACANAVSCATGDVASSPYAVFLADLRKGVLHVPYCVSPDRLSRCEYDAIPGVSGDVIPAVGGDWVERFEAYVGRASLAPWAISAVESRVAVLRNPVAMVRQTLHLGDGEAPDDDEESVGVSKEADETAAAAHELADGYVTISVKMGDRETALCGINLHNRGRTRVDVKSVVAAAHVDVATYLFGSDAVRDSSLWDAPSYGRMGEDGELVFSSGRFESMDACEVREDDDGDEDGVEDAVSVGVSPRAGVSRFIDDSAGEGGNYVDEGDEEEEEEEEDGESSEEEGDGSDDDEEEEEEEMEEDGVDHAAVDVRAIISGPRRTRGGRRRVVHDEYVDEESDPDNSFDKNVIAVRYPTGYCVVAVYMDGSDIRYAVYRGVVYYHVKQPKETFELTPELIAGSGVDSASPLYSAIRAYLTALSPMDLKAFVRNARAEFDVAPEDVAASLRARVRQYGDVDLTEHWCVYLRDRSWRSLGADLLGLTDLPVIPTHCDDYAAIPRASSERDHLVALTRDAKKKDRTFDLSKDDDARDDDHEIPDDIEVGAVGGGGISGDASVIGDAIVRSLSGRLDGHGQLLSEQTNLLEVISDSLRGQTDNSAALLHLVRELQATVAGLGARIDQYAAASFAARAGPPPVIPPLAPAPAPASAPASALAPAASAASVPPGAATMKSTTVAFGPSERVELFRLLDAFLCVENQARASTLRSVVAPLGAEVAAHIKKKGVFYGIKYSGLFGQSGRSGYGSLPSVVDVTALRAVVYTAFRVLCARSDKCFALLDGRSKRALGVAKIRLLVDPSAMDKSASFLGDRAPTHQCVFHPTNEGAMQPITTDAGADAPRELKCTVGKMTGKIVFGDDGVMDRLEIGRTGVKKGPWVEPFVLRRSDDVKVAGNGLFFSVGDSTYAIRTSNAKQDPRFEFDVLRRAGASDVVRAYAAASETYKASNIAFLRRMVASCSRSKLHPIEREEPAGDAPPPALSAPATPLAVAAPAPASPSVGAKRPRHVVQDSPAASEAPRVNKVRRLEVIDASDSEDDDDDDDGPGAMEQPRSSISLTGGSSVAPFVPPSSK